MSSFQFQVCMMSGRSSKTPLSSISRVGSLEERWFLTHIMDVGYVQEMSCFKFQVSFFDVRRVIKDTPIFHLQSWIFGGQVVPNPLSECRLCPSDVMFQISGLQDVRNIIKDTLIFHLQSWILRGQVVPDKLSGCRLCPGDVMFQILGLKDVRKVIKDNPILHLQSWILG